MSNSNRTKSKLKDFSKADTGKLYIVATPIGNMEDITLRAINILKSVDLILCEDTRLSANLLSKLGIKNKLGIYNDHSESKNKNKILEELQSGKAVALISDAGTPLISDPGYKLVEDVRAQGFQVIPIPGPSAVITALCASGLPTDNFFFAGFAPTTSGKLTTFLSDLKTIKSTIVLYESPNRLLKTLIAISEIFGDIEVSVARELTKLYEEIISNKIQSVIEHFNSYNTIKGEIVIMLNNRIHEEVDESVIQKELGQLLNNLSFKDAVDAVSKSMNVSRKLVYKLGLELINKR